MTEMSESPLGFPTDSMDDEQPIQRAAIYVRTSSPSQRMGYSIAEQIRQCVERCRAFDWSIAYVYCDEAKSGKDTDRPMFQEMLSQSDSGLIDVVVFWKLDRFSRSIMHAVQLEKQFRDWGVALHSVTEQIDTTTAAGRFNFRNLANSAEFERELIRQRTRMGHMARALEGKWPNGSPPLGYESLPDGRLRIIDSEASLIEWIFDRYIETASMPVVADELAEKETRNTKWDPSMVSSVLRNTLYTGRYNVGQVERFEPEYQIIEQDQFDEAKALRTRFQGSDGCRRERMNLDRKERHVANVLDQYREWIN